MIKNTKKLKPTVTPAVAVKPEAPKPAAPKVEAAKPQPVAAKPVAVAPAPAPKKEGRVSLELVHPAAKSVYVAGSFNGWKPEKTPLVRQGNGRWVGDLKVNPGKHEYLFVVDGTWVPDPNAAESVQNPYGGRNSILTVSE